MKTRLYLCFYFTKLKPEVQTKKEKTRLYLCFYFTKLKPEVQTKKENDAKGNRKPENTTPAAVQPKEGNENKRRKTDSDVDPDDDQDDKESDSEVTDARVGPGNIKPKPDVQTNNKSVAKGNRNGVLTTKSRLCLCF